VPSLQKLNDTLRERGKDLSNDKRPNQLKRVSSAAENMSALVDDIVKKARKSFKTTGSPELDARFLKESVGALRELFALLEDCDTPARDSEGIVIRVEKQIEEWGK
jgi:hypothetical protein